MGSGFGSGSLMKGSIHAVEGLGFMGVLQSSEARFVVVSLNRLSPSADFTTP